MSEREVRPRTAGHGETDALQRFVFERARVRGELARLDETWREVRRRRGHPVSVSSSSASPTCRCARWPAGTGASTRCRRRIVPLEGRTTAQVLERHMSPSERAG